MKPVNLLFNPSVLILFTLVLCLFVGQQAYAQTFCDSVQINTVQYSATNADLIEIAAMTLTNDCVSYPSFVLYDQNGDTLAKEMVNFFCLSMGNFMTHQMQVLSSAIIPFGPFDATMELFSGFGNNLVCSWDLTLDLCPQVSCTMAEIYLTNLDTLQAGTVYWYLTDINNTIWESGEIEMDLVSYTHFDSVCLAPGEYQLSVSPFSDIWIDESFILGITENYNHSNGTNTALQNDSTPQDLFFNWYEECVPATNSIEELHPATFSAFQQYGDLVISSLNNGSIGQIQLIDLQGRLLNELNAYTNSIRLNVDALPTGIYILRNRTANDTFSAQKVLIR